VILSSPSWELIGAQNAVRYLKENEIVSNLYIVFWSFTRGGVTKKNDVSK
jgi:hypothetical protein